MTSILDTYRRTVRIPYVGRHLFALGVRFQAPYFGTIRPLIVDLRPRHSEVTIRNRRRVHNHIGTVHAIACCNMAELAAGLLTDVTIPRGYRWIPKGMTVEYLAKATTDLRAVAEPADPSLTFPAEPIDWPVHVRILDTDDREVVTATITMRVGPNPTRTSSTLAATEVAS